VEIWLPAACKKVHALVCAHSRQRTAALRASPCTHINACHWLLGQLHHRGSLLLLLQCLNAAPLHVTCANFRQPLDKQSTPILLSGRSESPTKPASEAGVQQQITL
jgi:hypothetical protein